MECVALNSSTFGGKGDRDSHLDSLGNDDENQRGVTTTTKGVIKGEGAFFNPE